jgi:glutamyl-tRNA synthetase
MEQVRVRFAPSPTGYLHVGGARTALFNYLFAKKEKGVFILRIEDTDRSRYQESALQEIFTSLQWLGLQWDEGPEAGGEYGPYFQSQRTDLYNKMARELIDKGHAYPCFCTPERLEQVRRELERNKTQTTGYDRHCRNLSMQEVQDLKDAGNTWVIRFKIPLDRKVVFNDMIRGEITYDSNVLDDLVLIKSDGFPTYHLANVVDDHTMKISHVLRGDEWITSTPRHVLLYEAFGWEHPLYAHMPVILDPSGGKLSKRKGAASVMDYKKAGFLPEAVFNFLALLGWAPGDDREKMTIDALIEAFTLDRISPKGSVFDERKLDWMNGLYMQERSNESLLAEVIGEWKKAGYVPESKTKSDMHLQSIIELLKVRSKRITDLLENSKYFFVEPDVYEEKSAAKYFNEQAGTVLHDIVEELQQLSPFEKGTIEQVYREYSENTGLSGGVLIHPTRLAVSGVSIGPGLFELLEALGKETVVRRMRKAVVWVKENKTGK